ncbi:MAG: LuxR C-terminal-related transcriptional regulator, partial [Desulfuromonadales bacterium]
RFVIITRQDPFLPISSLRANHQLCELRTRDLEFSARDVQSYLETALARGIDAETAASWQERTEGWVTGLQLAVNTLAGQKDDAPEKVRVEQVNWRTVLTNREYEILLLLQERLRDKEIADRLCISAETVKTHLKNIYGKLQVGDRRDAVTRAQQLKIL